jgi:ABC-2 type transporter
VYNERLGESCESLVSYFESRGAPSISLGENPASWMLHVMTSGGLTDLSETYLQSDDFRRLKIEMNDLQSNPSPEMKIAYDSEFATSRGRRRELINRRLSLIYWRSPAYNLARVVVSLGIAVVLSSVFLFKAKMTLLTEVDMRAHLSVIFLSFIIVGIMAVLSVIPVMEKIRDAFYRHRDAGMYDSGSLGLALGVAEKYFIVFSSAIFCIVFLGISNVGNGIGGLIGFWVS